jgi:hypothetical protein
MVLFAVEVGSPTGNANIAVGASALQSNTTGNANIAIGESALQSNTSGTNNTAVGIFALLRNTTGANNAAFGFQTLQSNTSGHFNTAVGDAALLNSTTGGNNTAVGTTALRLNTAGTNNIGLGHNAGSKLISGNFNIYLGSRGSTAESNTTRLGETQTRTFIAGIAGTPLSGSQVVVSSTGQLGVFASSARYKRDVESMTARSRGLFQLRPVTFRYKQDTQGIRQYGLVAEEVAKVYPELMTRGTTGVVESVRYHELVPMMVNELQLQQRELGELRAQNERLRAALMQLQRQDEARWAQTAAFAAHLEKAVNSAPLASR